MAMTHLVRRLISDFPRHLAYYETNSPFNKPEQLHTHRRAMELRRKLGSVSASLASDTFIDALRGTLKAWGVGSHDAVLAERNEFRRQLRKHPGELVALENIQIEKANASTGERVWRVIQSLDIVLGRRTAKPTQSKSEQDRRR